MDSLLTGRDPVHNNANLGKRKEPDLEEQCLGCPNSFQPTSTTTADEDVFCPLSRQEKHVADERSDVRKRIKVATNKMVETTQKALPELQEEDNVLLPIPKMDRGPADPPNLLCQIVDSRNGVFQVACEKGVVKGWYGAKTLIAAGAAF